MLPVTMGTVYFGSDSLSYDISGAVVLKLQDGRQVVWLPDFSPSSMVQAMALGYGRQAGALLRDRLLACAFFLHVQGLPLASMECDDAGQLPGLASVDRLLLALNRVDAGPVELGPQSLAVADMLQAVLLGQGCFDA